MVKFSIIGDMGSGTNQQLIVAKSLNYIINKNDCKFVCGLGDNIYNIGCSSPEDKQFETKFEIPYKKISNNIKFFMSLGNHDYGLDLGIIKMNNSINQILYSQISEKKNKKWILPNHYYTFKKGNIQFYVIDTNLYAMTLSQINKQLKYIKEKINESTSKWNIIYGHHPYRSVGGHGNADEELNKFLKSIFKTGKIDLYMCGHDHNKQLIITKLPDNKYIHLLVCGTSGQDLDDYIDENNLDKKKSKLLWFSSTPGTALINSTNTTLNITFYNLKKSEYNYTITKK